MPSSAAPTGIMTARSSSVAATSRTFAFRLHSMAYPVPPVLADLVQRRYRIREFLPVFQDCPAGCKQRLGRGFGIRCGPHRVGSVQVESIPLDGPGIIGGDGLLEPAADLSFPIPEVRHAAVRYYLLRGRKRLRSVTGNH